MALGFIRGGGSHILCTVVHQEMSITPTSMPTSLFCPDHCVMNIATVVSEYSCNRFM